MCLSRLLVDTFCWLLALKGGIIMDSCSGAIKSHYVVTIGGEWKKCIITLSFQIDPRHFRPGALGFQLH